MATCKILERLQSAGRRVWAAWVSVQVELHGCYSVARLRRLATYSSRLSTRRLIAICLLTPLPSLVVSLVKELPPLASPDAGVYANWVFFLRSWAVTSYIGGSVLVHLNQCIPRLQLSTGQIIFVGAFAAAISTVVVFAISALTVFPLPFGLLVFGPPDAWVLIACFIYITRPLWRSDPNLWTEVKQQLDVIHSQMSLAFVYPVYIYGFVSLTGITQVIFVLTLPIIRLVAKNQISRRLTTHNDMKPEAVIFTVEVFNALYVSNALQLTSSWYLTGTVMILDVILFFSSLLDVVALLKDVTILMNKIPPGHPMTNENFLQIAMRILAIDGTWREAKYRRITRGSIENGEPSNHLSALSEKALDSVRVPTHSGAVIVDSSRTQRSMRQAFQNALVLPTFTSESGKSDQQSSAAEMPDSQSFNQFRMDITTIFSLSERAAFIDKATRVLFVTEYLVLMEYTEVMIPVIYCLHDVALFFMPNSAYYPALKSLSSADLLSSIQNVLVYALLELLSLIMFVIVLKHTVGFSPLQQLAFVLETQAEKLQNKLTVTFLYAMQISLLHLGADFSFKFAWLHSSKPSSC